MGLIEALVTRHGVDQAKEVYRSICPMAKASIGMHIRHSMDHVELAALVAENPSEESELHYDLRVRGGILETDMDEAKKRILNVSHILKDLSEKESTLSNGFVRIPVKATFFLSAEPIEYGLPSTIARELGTFKVLLLCSFVHTDDNISQTVYHGLLITNYLYSNRLCCSSRHPSHGND